jgi:hypothetical protein
MIRGIHHTAISTPRLARAWLNGRPGRHLNLQRFRARTLENDRVAEETTGPRSVAPPTLGPPSCRRLVQPHLYQFASGGPLDGAHRR